MLHDNHSEALYEKSPLYFFYSKARVHLKPPTACKHANLQPHDRWAGLILLWCDNIF